MKKMYELVEYYEGVPQVFNQCFHKKTLNKWVKNLDKACYKAEVVVWGYLEYLGRDEDGEVCKKQLYTKTPLEVREIKIEK